MAQITTASIITLIRNIIDDNLKTDGQNAFEYSSDSSFKLSKDYVDSTSIVVYVNGTDITSSNWSYSSDTNKVTISSSLTSGDNIIITFDYYESFSDTELQNFIKATLLEFSYRKYKKLFYMNSSNEVVTLDGENPTEEEGNLIATITAIKIDPQNMQIKMPGYTINAPEKMSRTEQIDHVFARFTRSFGVVKFLQEEEE